MPKKINRKKAEKVALLLGIGTSLVLESLRTDDRELIAKDKALKLAMEEWKNQALKQAEQASTIQEAKKVYRTAPDGEAQVMALEKWINFCSTTQELIEAYIARPAADVRCRVLTIRKLYKLI